MCLRKEEQEEGQRGKALRRGEQRQEGEEERGGGERGKEGENFKEETEARVKEAGQGEESEDRALGRWPSG